MAIAHAADIPEDVRDWPVAIVRAVVETVSAGREAARRDYVDKRAAYERAGIPIYVIVDPRDGTWLVLLLTDGIYQAHAKGSFGEPIPLPEPLGFPIPTGRPSVPGLTDLRARVVDVAAGVPAAVSTHVTTARESVGGSPHAWGK